MAMIFKEAFGTTKAGIPVDRYSMTNQAGMQVDILTYGAAIQKILIPVGDGRYTDVALGYNTLEDYENGSSNHGAFVGRYANRIKDASFTLDGVTYRLEANDGPNHLHGTYIRTVFGAHIENGALIMEYTSPDGEEGYPGTLQLKITYTLDEDNTLRMVYEAETDKATVINLTNHTYFNLRGQDGSTCADTVLTMQADSFAEGSAGNLPTGRFLPVDGTPMDFRKGRRIGDGLDLAYELPMNRSVCPKATIIPSYWKRRKAKKNGLPPRKTRPAPSVWTAGPPSPAYSSIPATMSMKTMWTTARPAAATLSTALSAWRPSTTPAAPIILSSRQRYCVPARITASPLPTDSP